MRQAESGTTVVDICRKLGVTETTFYRCNKQYTGLDVSELRELKQLREENRRPKSVVAGLSPTRDAARRPRNKMVRPAQRPAAVSGALVAFQVSERRACRGLVVHRATIRYQSVKPDDAPMRRRLHELAKAGSAFGVKRLHTLLRRDGLVINLKKERRLYLEEQLQLSRGAGGGGRRPSDCRAEVGAPTKRWAMDFMHDVLATGQPVRVFTLVDVYSRECVALQVAKSFSGADVARMLSDASERAGGSPPIIQCDNGTEFTSTALDHWAYWHRVLFDFSRPGKPVDNSVCEAFKGSLRRECLRCDWFASLLEAQTELSTWRADYNNLRPHTSLGLQTTAQYRASGDYLLRSLRRDTDALTGPGSGTQAPKCG